MALVLFHSEKVKQTLKAPMAFGVELFLFGAIGAVVGLLVVTGKQWSAPPRNTVDIDLNSIGALAKYTILSLGRGFAAYAISLIFTLIYGTVAAHSHRAERVMIPILDVLQAIPVLGFLPGFLLTMLALFPTHGLEMACILMIFTGQAWNMTFSFHASLRGIPGPLREVAAIQRFSFFQTFRIVEVPAAMIGLVWNSMMSMAGGWFFLTVAESFQLGDKDYRLPGIGSYVAEAINKHNMRAMILAIIAMILMIVMVDQLFWRPIVVWSKRFKLEDSAEADAAQSWVLNLFGRSLVVKWFGKLARRLKPERKPVRVHLAHGEGGALDYGKVGRAAAPLVRGAVLLGLLALFVIGAWDLVSLLLKLKMVDSSSQIGADYLHVFGALVFSFLRTSAAVLLGAAWALPAGIVIGLSRKWSQRLQPVVQVLASFPAPMLFPLVVIALDWLHVDFGIGCVALMLLGSQWYVLFNVIAGATAIPADLKEAATVFRMPRIKRWTQLYLPCVFPYLVTGLVTAAGGAWNATIVAEYFQSGDRVWKAFGLGTLISEATNTDNRPLLAASVVVMAVFVVMLNRILWKRLYRLAEARYSLVV